MSDQAELDAVKSISDDFDRLDAAMTAIQNAFESAKLDGQSVPVDLANAITAAKTKGDTDASAAEQKAATDAPEAAPLPEPPAETGGAAPVTDSTQPPG